MTQLIALRTKQTNANINGGGIGQGKLFASLVFKLRNHQQDGKDPQPNIDQSVEQDIKHVVEYNYWYIGIVLAINTEPTTHKVTQATDTRGIGVKCT